MTTTTPTRPVTTTTNTDELELLETLAKLATRFGYERILDVLADGAEAAWDAAETPAQARALSTVAERLRYAQAAAHRVEASQTVDCGIFTPANGLEVLADAAGAAAVPGQEIVHVCPEAAEILGL